VKSKPFEFPPLDKGRVREGSRQDIAKGRGQRAEGRRQKVKD